MRQGQMGVAGLVDLCGGVYVEPGLTQRPVSKRKVRAAVSGWLLRR